MYYKLSKITQDQLDKLPKTELGKSILANYNEIKKFTDNFKVEYEALKEQDKAIYQNIIDALNIENKKEVKPKTVSKPSAKKSNSKGLTEAEADVSWKKKIAIKDMHQFGKVYELKVVEGAPSEIGVLLDKGIKAFIKGNVVISVRKGELVVFVCVNEDSCEYTQYNVVGNYKEKCLFKAQLFKNGKRKAIDCKTDKESQKEMPKKTAKDKKEPCPPTPCPDKKETTKPKPQQYKSEKAQGQALAELTYLYGSNAKIGNADQIITKILRRKDNRIVLQMNDFSYTRSGARAISGTEQYFLFQEKDRKIIKSEMPAEYTLVDAKKEVLKQGEEAKSNLLDSIYSKKEEIHLCYAVEKEMLKCKEGACDASEKAYYQGLLKECSDKAGKQQFFNNLEKQFLKVFNSQKRGESFWQAYNRIAKEAKKVKVA